MTSPNWTTQNIPDQTDKVIIITGATSGLGKQAAKIIAGKNATVIMAVRNIKKAEGVADQIRAEYKDAKLDIRSLDLSSLKSIKNFASDFLKSYDKLDILINNAGVMACPYSKTEDNFEIQMGTNHFGPFALTGLLMPILKKTPNSRIVSTSSFAHLQGNIDFSDINWENRKYSSFQAYSDSKMANLYFTYELAKKNENGHPLVIVAHPGWTKTELDRYSAASDFFGRIFAQKVDMGSLPTLRAAFDPEAKPGDFFGPDGWFGIKGYPIKVKSNKLSHNQDFAKELWNTSEKLTGIMY
jgi:NAD(P)-dependent dehydrogenase (short-subunit alcohol dehydrogenase family)